jgi:hypothetical protein
MARTTGHDASGTRVTQHSNPVVELATRISELRGLIVEAMHTDRARDMAVVPLDKIDSAAAELVDLSSVKAALTGLMPNEQARESAERALKVIEQQAARLVDLHSMTLVLADYKKAVLEEIDHTLGGSLEPLVIESLKPRMAQVDYEIFPQMIADAFVELQSEGFITGKKMLSSSTPENGDIYYHIGMLTESGKAERNRLRREALVQMQSTVISQEPPQLPQATVTQRPALPQEAVKEL